MPTTRITEILNLQQAITGDTFLRLGIHVLEAEKLEEQQRKTRKETKLIALDELQLSKSGKRAIDRVGRKTGSFPMSRLPDRIRWRFPTMKHWTSTARRTEAAMHDDILGTARQ